MADNLNQMKVFVSVASHQSFTGAAGALGMSNSAVTKHIQQLEARLGVRLLHRNTRTLALTKIGESYMSDCVDILNDVDTSETTVRDSAVNLSGTIRVNAPLDLVLTRLPERLEEFYSHLPNTSLRLFLNNEFVDTIDGGYDVTIRISESLPQTTSRVYPIGTISRKLIISPKLLEGQAPIETPDDLARFNCLSYSHCNKSEIWTFEGKGIASPCKKEADGSLHSNNGLALLAAVAAGHGIAMLPDFIVLTAIDEGDVVEIDIGLKAAPLQIYALCPLKPHVPEKVRKLVELLQSAYNEAREQRPHLSQSATSAH